jgi:hypothetical protein
MFNFGIDDFQAFRPENPNYQAPKSYRWIVSFEDGSLGVVLESGFYSEHDPVFSAGPREKRIRATKQARNDRRTTRPYQTN